MPRARLLALIADRRKHPLYKFIFPQYEESTKSRALNTDVGYYICGQSTLLWTPFSVSCQQCAKAEACKQRTRQAYPELYRIRTEEFNQNEIIIETEEQEIKIERKNISQIKTVYNW